MVIENSGEARGACVKGVATGLFKTPRTQLKKTGKNDIALIPVLTHSKPS